MNIVSRSNYMLVAAIEMGTTSSMYAYSLKETWRNVFSDEWDDRPVTSIKTPTCLLLKKDYTESLFGSLAEDKYSELKSEEGHCDYYFFKDFTKILHEGDINQHALCYDVTGKSLNAALVFEHSIRFLKERLLRNSRFSVLGIQDNDIKYIFAVPAIGGENAKMVMREAAVNAGIKQEKLTIILEPEAASIYCQYLNIFKEGRSSPLLVVKPDTKYMLIHLESTGVNITVHQKCEDNTLEEIVPTTEGPWGGNSVNDQFVKFLSELVGKTVWEEFIKEHNDDYLDMMECFESHKRRVKPDKCGNTRLPIPRSFSELSIQYHRVKTFKEVIEKNEAHKNNVNIVAGKLLWDNDFFRNFFKKTIDGIVKHIDEILQISGAKDVGIIVMVGCLSECLLVQDAIKKYFGHLSIIVPQQPELAVLKGAVYFGHIPEAIPRRSARYTYGIQTWPEFNEAIHPEEKKVECGKSSRCRDVFLKVVTKGDKITEGFTKSQVFRAPYNRENVLECGLFISEKKNPKFVDDPGCKLLGTLQVPFSPNKQNTETLVEEKLVFGVTELKFTAEDIFSGLKYEINFDLLKD